METDWNAQRHQQKPLVRRTEFCTQTLWGNRCILRSSFTHRNKTNVQTPKAGSDSRERRARTPFDFKSAVHLMFIDRERAQNIEELREALRTCRDESIFQHTFHTLEEHHFIKEGFSNDFAQWTYASLGEVGLGERLAGLDIREFTSLGDLRSRLITIVEEYGAENPKARERTASEPFYFCSSRKIVLPPLKSAATLAEFIDGLAQVTLHSIHYHFIDARLRRKLESNDFSIWLERDLGLEKEATLLNQIDIYTSTLEGVRRKIITILRSSSQRTYAKD